jgi:hypothetical protein
MDCWSFQPSLDEVMGDELTQAMMAADGVDPQALAATLRAVAASRRDAPRRGDRRAATMCCGAG